jgi:hypothetical protein
VFLGGGGKFGQLVPAQCKTGSPRDLSRAYLVGTYGWAVYHPTFEALILDARQALFWRFHHYTFTFKYLLFLKYTSLWMRVVPPWSRNVGFVAYCS